MEGSQWEDDPVHVYLSELRNIPELTKDEESTLSRHVLENDQDAESAGLRLVESNLSMVVTIAQRYKASGVHVLDLIREGNTGLLLALNTFADTPSETFSAHAANCVHRAITKAIRSRPL